MRIHTDKLSHMHIIHALQEEKVAGRIAFTVGFKTREKKGSRSHARAFEVQLESYEKVDGDGRRYGNSGSFGAGENYTATYDEWGFFLEALYRLDPYMVVGSAKNPVYEDRADFHHKTGYSYSADLPKIIRESDDPYPYVVAKNTAGRRGAGRNDGGVAGWDNYYWIAEKAFMAGEKSSTWITYAPRTPEEAAAFVKVALVPAQVVA